MISLLALALIVIGSLIFLPMLFLNQVFVKGAQILITTGYIKAVQDAIINGLEKLTKLKTVKKAK